MFEYFVLYFYPHEKVQATIEFTVVKSHKIPGDN